MNAIDHTRRLCSLRERCSSEALGILTRRGSADPLGDLELLRVRGYVDDCRYAKCFASDKARLSGWGPVKIAAALRGRGIAPELIEDALKECDSPQAVESMRKAVRAKWETLGGEEPYTRRLKTMRHAAGRGCTAEQAERLVREIEADECRLDADTDREARTMAGRRAAEPANDNDK